MTFANKYPKLRPSLLLDFAGSKIVDPRITFSRPSKAWYFDNKGVLRPTPAGVPRIDYDPVTGECRGLLVEEQRTNLLKYSEQFDNVVWGKVDVSVTPNAITAPDGTLTAYKLVEGAATGHHLVYQNPTLVDNTVYCNAVFAKAAERSHVIVVITDKSNIHYGRNFNLLDGTSSPAGVVNAPSAYGITSVGNGWYFCWVAQSAGVGATTNTPRVYISNGTTNNYTGDGTSGLYIWGAQLEEGSFPTSYIPTTDAQVTRAADIPSMIGTNFSDWYQQGEGTFVVDYRCDHIGGPFFPSAWYVRSDMSNRFGHTVPRVNKNVFYDSITDGVTTVELGFANTKDDVKSAFTYKLNDVAASTFGANALTHANTTIPSVNRLEIGHRSLVAQLNGHIRNLTYYPRRITNEQLQALSSI